MIKITLSEIDDLERRIHGNHDLQVTISGAVAQRLLTTARESIKIKDAIDFEIHGETLDEAHQIAVGYRNRNIVLERELTELVSLVKESLGARICLCKSQGTCWHCRARAALDKTGIQ